MRPFIPERSECEICGNLHAQVRLFWIEGPTIELLWDAFGQRVTLFFIERHRNRVLCERCIAQEAEKIEAAQKPDALKIVKSRLQRVLNGARSAERRASQRRQMPGWADREAIKSIYREAQRLTRETGILHHVDHIYPLVSDYVSGLHVENNLQILIATENLKKSNKVEVGPELKASRRPPTDSRPLAEQIWRDLYPSRPATDTTPRLKKH